MMAVIRNGFAEKAEGEWKIEMWVRMPQHIWGNTIKQIE